jgi:hypothetical protein
MNKKWLPMLLILFYHVGSVGCQTHHAVELAPVEIKPIHITIDVNVRVDRALDNFFEDIDTAGKEIKGGKALKK